MLMTATETRRVATTASLDFPDIASEISTGILPEQFRTNLERQSRILAQTQNLVLLPTVSPLCVGHVLVFSKEEHLNFGEVQRVYASIRDEIQSLIAEYAVKFGRPLIFEHGSMRGGQVACGVSRAHIHLLPQIGINTAGIETAIQRELGPAVTSSFADLRGLGREYIFLSEGLDDVHLWEGDCLPSQLIRRHIATQLGLERWNWRSLFGWPVVAQTIAEWTRARRIYEPAD